MKRTRSLLCGLVCLALAAGAAGSLFAEETGEELIVLVIDLLGSKDKDERALGLNQVRSEAKGQAATRRFAAQLSRLSPEAQVGLLSALADRGDATARPAVLELFAASRDPAVRVGAVAALGFLGEPGDARLLVRSLAGSSKPEAAAARGALVRLRGENAPKQIVAEMKAAPAPVRAALIEILATRRARDTVPDLLAAALDSDAKVRAAAMSALGQLAGPEQLEGMVRGVLKSHPGAEREGAERAVALICNRNPDPAKRAEPLLAIIDKQNAVDRLVLLPTLGRIGGPAALKLVEAALANQQPVVHEVGLRALCNWPDASVAPRLVELAKGDSHMPHRALALAAIVRIAPLADQRTDAQRLDLLKQAMGMSTRDAERIAVLKRARTIRTLAALQFLLPYLDQPAFAQVTCESIVELAHHRDLREPNKKEFDPALDKVMKISNDATVVDRAQRYKKNQTWARPTVADGA